MERFSCSVIMVMAISTAFELGLVAGLGHHELARPSQGDLAFRADTIRSQDEPAVRQRRPFQFVPSTGIQDSKELNKTCCLNGGTCMLGSFCACPPSFYGRNCEHDLRKENCGSVPHGTWLPRRCSMCKCWHGRLRCFPQAFLPGCGDEQSVRPPGGLLPEHLSRAQTLLGKGDWQTDLLSRVGGTPPGKKRPEKAQRRMEAETRNKAETAEQSR
uniref:Teratocarcinoma-derived growth factor 1 n=1 Tax=Equus asinus asinus TaxID=83772 RepID=A0A8C4LGB0_EQUAS